MTDLKIESELRALSESYARSADRRDGDTFADVFHVDGVLIVHPPEGAGEPTVRRGIDELRAVPSLLTRYEQTFHFLGQSRFVISMTTAAGEVYCIAHHLHHLEDGRPADRVLYVRYEDEYATSDQGTWRIVKREVRIDWATLEAVELVR